MSINIQQTIRIQQDGETDFYWQVRSDGDSYLNLQYIEPKNSKANVDLAITKEEAVAVARAILKLAGEE